MMKKAITNDMTRVAIGLHKESYQVRTEAMCSHINVGSGEDFAIRDSAESIKKTVGFEGMIVSDDSKPDGSLRKLMDSQRLRGLGWMPAVGLEQGLGLAYVAYQVA